jgi:hypothetical protein
MPPEIAVQYIKDIAKDLLFQEKNKRAFDLLNAMEEEAINRGLCPNCGSEYEVRTHLENYEAWGREVTERLNSRYCSCGWEG